MGHLRVQLFGKLYLQVGERVLVELNTHKAEELFSYLLLNRAQKHNRETLADLFCRECSTVLAKKTLRQLLWLLQPVIDATASPGQEPLFLVQRDWVQVNPACDLWLDVDIFERAYALVQDRAGEGLSA